MPSIVHMAQAIAGVEGSGLSTPHFNRLYRRLLRLGSDSLYKLESCYAASLPKLRQLRKSRRPKIARARTLRGTFCKPRDPLGGPPPRVIRLKQSYVGHWYAALDPRVEGLLAIAQRDDMQYERPITITRFFIERDRIIALAIE